MVTLTPQSDERLLRWVTQRDEDALRSLMDAWLPLVRTVCRRVLGRHDLVEDAVQETFLTLAREADHIHGHIGSWLYRTALNHAIDLRRSEQARSRREVHVGREQHQCEDFQAPAEHEFLLEECLGELDPAQRAVIHAYYFEGASQYAIAERCGVSQVAIKKRIDRALMTLRLKLVRRGIDLIAPPSRDGRAHGAPLLIPIGWKELAYLVGIALLFLMFLRPREAWSRLQAACVITGHLVCALLGTVTIATAPTLRPSVRLPWWLKAMRLGTAGAGAMVTLAAVLVGRR